MITWVLYLCIGVVIGGMAGFYFAKLDDFSKKQKQDLEEKLQKSERELVEYKDQVTAHFMETANLINNMTESYQKVHEHLANGSVELCNNAVEVNKLTISTSQLLSSASKNKPNVEEVTSLATKKAPKNLKHDNNNNNIDYNEAMMDTSELGTPGSTLDSNQESNPASVTMAKQATVTETASPGNDVDTGKPAVNAQFPETMAVAEDDNSATESTDKLTEESKEESKSKSRLPGNLLVH